MRLQLGKDDEVTVGEGRRGYSWGRTMRLQLGKDDEVTVGEGR